MQKKSRKLALARETLRSMNGVHGADMADVALPSYAVPTCYTCRASCNITCNTCLSCNISCGGTCEFTCQYTCTGSAVVCCA
jgi:hypothetical protein